MASLRWYARRLRSMTGAELVYRTQQTASVIGERVRVAVGPDWPSDNTLRAGLGLSPASTWEDWALQASSRMGALRPSPSRRSAFEAAYPREVDALRARASAVARGHVELFGETVALGSAPSWHRDPKTGREWPPRAFYSSIDIRGGGAKGIWEPARHQHLVPIAQSAWLDGHSAAIEPIESSLTAWWQQQSWRRGIHWCSGLEMAVRLASWTWIAVLAGDRLSAGLWREWTRGVVQYGAHLERHLSLHSSANNHLIGEAAGLVLAAHFVPEWKAASRWQTLGRAVLVREIDRQILADGTPAEQAFHYLGFILDFYFLVLRVCPGLIEDGHVRERIGSAAAFASAVGNEAMDLPAVGDDDGGAAWVMSSTGTTWRSRLALSAAWTGRGDLKQRGGELDPAAWWMLPDERLQAWQALPEAPTAPTSVWLRTGGYAALRTPAGPERLVVFDCGPLGYLSIAAHGHADCLSFCLSLNGRWVLVDPGTFVYHELPEWRTHLRGTVAHNTLAVAGADQSEQTGHTMWGRRATARWVAFDERGGFRWAEGEHDGYTHLAPPCRHQRVVGLADDDYLIVIDWLSARTGRVLWHYQCAPGMVAVSQGQNVVASAEGLRLSWQVLHEAKVRVIEGQDRPLAGWVSPAFGIRRAAPVIEVECEGRANVPYVTLIGFGSDPPHATLQEQGAEWLVTVSHPGGCDRIALRSPRAAGSASSTIRNVTQ